VRKLVVVAMACGMLPVGGAAAAGPGEGGGKLVVTVSGLRSERGFVQLCVTRNAKAFPDCSDDQGSRKLTAPASEAARGIVIEGLAEGDYAISLIHDENGNRKLDTMLGIPREGVGFSRNPPIRFGAPGFVAAHFAVGAQAARQDIRVKYFL